MASELKVDKFTGVTTAGSIDVTGEGNSTTTNLQQGLAKSWINLNGTGTIAERDSFNISGITDNGTGQTTVAINNDHANSNYNVSSSSNQGGFLTPNGTRTASQYRIDVSNHSGTATDGEYTGGTTHGDLA